MSSPTTQDGWGDLLEEATALVAALVASAPVDTDWSVTAPGLEWTLQRVVEHIADSLVFYGAQLVRRRTEKGWAPFDVRVEGEQTPESLADIVVTTGRVLAATVRQAAPRDQGYHFYGAAGPRDSAAMGILESLVHGEDVRRGLDLPWSPPTAPVRAVLAHLLGVADAGDDPWHTLLERCGRTGGSDDWGWVNTGS